MSMRKKVILDWDGVIHSYTSRWAHASHSPDPPVEGSIEMIREYLKHFRVAIWSARSARKGGIDCMKNYLLNYGLTQEEVKKIEWMEEEKPNFHVFIDDRVMRFEGTFPSVTDILELKQWNK